MRMLPVFAGSVVVVSFFLVFSSVTVFGQAPAAKSDSPSATVSVDPEVEAGVKTAVEAFNKTNFVGAYDTLKALYDKHPELAPPRIVMAQWFAQAELGEAVRASLEAATAETPDDPEAYLLLGEISLRQRFLTAAELLLQQAAEKLEKFNANPDRQKQMWSSLLRNRVALAEARNRWTDMETAIDQAIKLDGETATLLRQKGVALFQQKKDAEAQATFAQADTLKAEGETQGLPAEAALSQLYQLRGDKENARIFLAEALTKYPNSREVLALSIQARMNDDKLEEAQDLAEKLLKDNPDLEAAKRLRATIALYLGDSLTAEKLFQELILAAPTDTQAVNGLALALCEQAEPNKLRRALEYAQENVRKDQQNADFWATLGWILYKANQFEQSAQALKQAAGGGQVSAATAYYLARLAVHTGKTTEAKQLLEAAVGSPSPFAKRRDAVQLLNELKK